MVLVNLASYILGIFFRLLFPVVFSREQGVTTATIGGLRFCGGTIFVNDCLLAVQQELPKYDQKLQEQLLAEKFKLLFFDQTRESINKVKEFASPLGYQVPKSTYFFTAGFFSIPEWAWNRGDAAAGICSFIVFRYFQAMEIGTGIRAAVRYSDRSRRRAAFARAADRMRAWLKEVDYPARWTDCYRKIESTSISIAPKPAQDTSHPSC